MAKSKYDPETKAAVITALLQGQGVPKVAKDYNIPPQTVYGWKSKEIDKGIMENLSDQKNEQIGDLIMAGLKVGLETTQAIAKSVQSPQWLNKQNAADLAVLYGVMDDKNFRIIEMLSRAGEQGGSG